MVIEVPFRKKTVTGIIWLGGIFFFFFFPAVGVSSVFKIKKYPTCIFLFLSFFLFLLCNIGFLRPTFFLWQMAGDEKKEIRTSTIPEIDH